MAEDSPPASWTPAAGPPATGLIADINLRRYTFASRESMSAMPLPSPSARRSSLHAPSSKASPSQDLPPGPSRTLKSSTALAHPYVHIPTAAKARTVSFQDLDRTTEEDGGGRSKRATVTSKSIPKPPGQAGRGTRGGYRVESKVEWTEELFNEIEVCDGVTASQVTIKNSHISLPDFRQGQSGSQTQCQGIDVETKNCFGARYHQRGVYDAYLIVTNLD